MRRVCFVEHTNYIYNVYPVGVLLNTFWPVLQCVGHLKFKKKMPETKHQCHNVSSQ